MTYYNRKRLYTANPGGLAPAVYRQAARGLAAGELKLEVFEFYIIFIFSTLFYLTNLEASGLIL